MQIKADSACMLTLESWSFPVLGEVSFSTRTLPNCYNVYVRFREGQGLKVLTKNIEVFFRLRDLK